MLKHFTLIRVYRIESDRRIGSDIRSDPKNISDRIRFFTFFFNFFLLLILCFLHILDHKEQKKIHWKKILDLEIFFWKKKFLSPEFFLTGKNIFCSLWSKTWRKHKISKTKLSTDRIGFRIGSENPIRSEPIRSELAKNF